MGCPKRPMWESGANSGRKPIVCPLAALMKAVCANDALHVIGLYGLGDKISPFLQDWELAMVTLS